MKKVLVGLASLLVVFSTTAAEKSKYDDVLKKFKAHFPFAVVAIEESPASGLVQIVTEQGVFYSTVDANNFIQGSLFEFKKGFKNLTTQRMQPLQKQKLNALKGSMLKYKAENEKTEIFVFTDVTCGYCGKLHREMQDYLDKGITVNYIGYPRSGMRGSAFDLNKNVWCSEDKKKAFNDAFNRVELKENVCDAQLDKTYRLGEMFKVTGTPAILTADMNIISGYLNATQLSERLGLK